jgi:biopolymer transport protein ExbB/TolQ
MPDFLKGLLEWFRNGGPIMYVILVVALSGLSIFIERLWVIGVSSRINGPAFIDRIMQLVRAGRTDDAVRLCAASRAALPQIGLLILRNKSRDEGDLQTVSDAAALAIIPRITRRLQYLPMLANVATLIGLFGTIYGLKAAFASVADVEAAQRAEKLAAGIAIALNATGFGLATAIPLVVGHSYLAAQAEQILEEMDEFSVRLINALVDRPDVRLTPV